MTHTRGFLIAVAVLVLLLDPGTTSVEAAETRTVSVGKVKEAFELRHFKRFIDVDLSRPKPACTLEDMGIPARTIEGQLVDHQGKPIPAVAVAIVEPIGYSGHCYFDNFDRTDKEGRFRVSGSVTKTRLIFRKENGRLWPVELRPEQSTLQVRWPQPSSLVFELPPEFAEKGNLVAMQSRNYWSGMSVLRIASEEGEVGKVRFGSVPPGDFVIVAYQTLRVGGKTITLPVELVAVQVAEGEEREITSRSTGTILRGQLDARVLATANHRNGYVIVERFATGYKDQPPVADLIAIGADGKFESRPLSPGHYSLRVMQQAVVQAGGRFGGGGDRAVASWHAIVDGSADTIDVLQEEEKGPLETVIQGWIARSVPNAKPTGAIAKLIRDRADRADVEARLVEMMCDPTTPYRWRVAIEAWLAPLIDSPAVLAGFRRALREAVDFRSRADLLRSLQSSVSVSDAVPELVTPYGEDASHITRGIVTRVLGEWAVKHPQEAKRVTEPLAARLQDHSETTRLTAADYLGRIGDPDSVPLLLAQSDDASGPVAVMAAFGAWKITGDADQVYPVMTAVLRRRGIGGMWHAAYFMAEVAKEHDVPEETQTALRQVVSMAGKPPFRSTYEYEQSRAAKAAAKVLEQIEGDSAQETAARAGPAK